VNFLFRVNATFNFQYYNILKSSMERNIGKTVN
jgi:hypothetical protein